jgi:DNA-binding NarL/FixJ family response regulator
MNRLSMATVVSGLYAAAAGRQDWKFALDAVADLLELLVVQVLGIDSRNGQLRFSSVGGPVDPQAALDYFRHYSTIDPRTPLALATPPEQWMHCHEHIDERIVARHEFFQQFLLPYGGRYVSATKLIVDGDLQFFIGLSRGRQSVPFGPTELPLLDELKLHFTEAFRNLVHLRHSFAELGMARELLGPFFQPMLMVDETGSLWHRNEAAIRLLAASKPLIEVQGYLRCSHAAAQSRLSEAIHEVLLAASQGAGLSRRAVVLPSEAGQRMIAFVSAMRPETALGAFGTRARALVIVHDSTTADDLAVPRPMILAECFGLTPAEARVATQIARGLTVKDIARRSGAALSTVRTQLASVMQKAEVDRQAELVRVLLTLPVRG